MITLSLLGSPQIHVDGNAVPFTVAKGYALLAYLALSETPQSRTFLMNLLWAKSDPVAGRKNLRNHLSLIRKALGEEALVIEDDLVCLSNEVTTDVLQFASGLTTQLQQAHIDPDRTASLIAHWRGPLLDTLRLHDAPDFELWLLAERERLEQLYRQGLLRLAQVYHTAERWADLVTTTQTARKHDDTDEVMARLLMESYTRLGQKSQALKVYEQIGKVLRRELNVEPQPETVALYKAILQDTLDVASQPNMSPAANTVETTDMGKLPPLVGRTAELATLRQCYEKVLQRQMQVVLLAGTLGIGKTSLWQTWAAQVIAQQQSSGPILLETVCLNTTQPLSFGPIIRLLNREMVRSQLPRLASGWRRLLTRLHPDLSTESSISPPSSPLSPSPSPSIPSDFITEQVLTQSFEALTQLLRILPFRPLLFFIDDLHWVDQTTLDWLTYLMDRMKNEQLLLVAAYQPEETPMHLNQTLSHWHRIGQLTRVDVPSLTLDDATELVNALAVDVDDVAHMHRQSGGNPYIFKQLLQTSEQDLPLDLTQMMITRIAQLPNDAQQLLQAAAVLEPGIHFELLQQLSKCSEEETVDGVDILLDANMLREEGQAYAFVQPFLAHVIHQQLSHTRRRFLHRRAAEMLEMIYAEELDRVTVQLIRHHAEAQQLDRAAHYAEMAGHHAFAIGAMHEAKRFLAQAIEYEETPARLFELGRVLTYLSGQLTQGRQMMQEGYAQMLADGNKFAAGAAAVKLTFSYFYAGTNQDVMTWAERAQAHFEENPAIEDERYPEMACGLYFALGISCLRTERFDQAETHLQQAIAFSTAHNLTVLPAILSWGGLSRVYVERCDYEQAYEAGQQAVAGAQAANNLYHHVIGYSHLARVAYLSGKLEVAEAHVTEALALAEAYVIQRPMQYILRTHGDIALAQNKPAVAKAWFQQALTEAQTYENQDLIAEVQMKLADC
ncbi:MAG: AAA family ATPase [Chloroflexota bacterium]